MSEDKTTPPPESEIAALRADIRELRGALQECTRVTLALHTKLDMVAFAQLAGEAKGIAHDAAIAGLYERVEILEATTAAE